MDAKEIEVFEALRDELNEGDVTRSTSKQAQVIYNRYNDKKITYCMCQKVKRHIYATQFIQWYEANH